PAPPPPSSPTRRSSDLVDRAAGLLVAAQAAVTAAHAAVKASEDPERVEKLAEALAHVDRLAMAHEHLSAAVPPVAVELWTATIEDRKSTRLNSSHGSNS